MKNKDEATLAAIVIEADHVDAHEVDAEVLGRIITGFQNIAWVLACSIEGVNYDERLRVSAELKKKYTLKAELSKKGSFVQPIKIPNQKMATKMLGVFSAVASGNLEELQEIVPDSRLRGRLCEKVIDVLPHVGENWQMQYQYKSHSLRCDSRSYHRVKKWREESLKRRPADETLTIKGELLSIDFAERQLEVRYPPTKRVIKCFYLPEIEDSIVESRKGLIEVTGQFVLDVDQNPEKLTEVFSIQPVDLSDMTLMGKVQQNERSLKVISPIVLTPVLDEESKQLYVLEDDSLKIHVFAQTREELMFNLIEQIYFLWDTYGNPDPAEKLTFKAIALGENLRKSFKESDKSA